MKCEISIYLTRNIVVLLNHRLQSATVQMTMQGYFKMILRKELLSLMRKEKPSPEESPHRKKVSS